MIKHISYLWRTIRKVMGWGPGGGIAPRETKGKIKQRGKQRKISDIFKIPKKYSCKLKIPSPPTPKHFSNGCKKLCAHPFVILKFM